MLRTPVPLLPRHLDIAGDAGDVERRADGMKLRFEAVQGVGGLESGYAVSGSAGHLVRIILDSHSTTANKSRVRICYLGHWMISYTP